MEVAEDEELRDCSFNLLTVPQKKKKQNPSLVDLMPGSKSPVSFVSLLDLENLSVFRVTDVNKKTPGRSSEVLG